MNAASSGNGNDGARPVRSLTIGLVAGESSGDNLGAALIEAIAARAPGTRFVGVAGPRMQAAGCERVADAHELAVMGLFEVLHHLPRLLSLRRRVRAVMRELKPDVFVGIDAPEFNLGLAADLHEAGLRTVQYVSPQVWAWRRGRAGRMARYLDLVLCLLPFEQAVYDEAGLAAIFVGHPLADQLPLTPDAGSARRELGIEPEARVVAILPGSRTGEVARLADDFAGTAAWLAARRPGVAFVAALADAATRATFEVALRRRAPGVAVRVVEGQTQAALNAADVVLVASGTATLETLLCKRPMVVAYRLGGLTAFLLRGLGLLKAPFFAQPNLLAGRQVVPELAQGEVTPERLGAELERWLDAPEEVSKLQSLFTDLHGQLRRDASGQAAQAVLALARGTPS
ncbi:MAG: lipid-A-disaccharide synthase [Gammaproteobacteria bacterium]|nr:lipid-A-disaccharide synthase [Gammaproteobacteria bacterium]